MASEAPPRTLGVILGSSEFPASSLLTGARSFLASASDFKKYLLDPRGLSLGEDDVLTLFDDPRSPSEQLVEIADFLAGRTLSERTRPAGLLLYYVGHGLFARGDQSYCLAVRCTNQRQEGATSIRAVDLAQVVKDNAGFLRRYLILDCCFAATIYKEFMSGPLQAARLQIADDFPKQGTALLCSSSAREPSLAPAKLEHTMFSFALLRALREGHPTRGAQLSFSDIGEMTQENLRTAFPNRWVRPEVHTPDQREGLIASIPLFPNPAFHHAPDTALIGNDQKEPKKEVGKREQVSLLPSSRMTWVAAAVLLLAVIVAGDRFFLRAYRNAHRSSVVSGLSGPTPAKSGIAGTLPVSRGDVAPNPALAKPILMESHEATDSKPLPTVPALTDDDIAQMKVRASVGSRLAEFSDDVPIREVKLSVDGPSEVLGRIKEVDYDFPRDVYPPYHPNPKIGRNPSNRFGIAYRGAGCVESIAVVIVPLSPIARKKTLPSFNLCSIYPKTDAP
jgi:hypothetical protein